MPGGAVMDLMPSQMAERLISLAQREASAFWRGLATGFVAGFAAAAALLVGVLL